MFYEAEGEVLLTGYVGEEKDLVLPETFNGRTYGVL